MRNPQSEAQNLLREPDSTSDSSSSWRTRSEEPTKRCLMASTSSNLKITGSLTDEHKTDSGVRSAARPHEEPPRCQSLPPGDGARHQASLLCASVGFTWRPPRAIRLLLQSSREMTNNDWREAAANSLCASSPSPLTGSPAPFPGIIILIECR